MAVRAGVILDLPMGIVKHMPRLTINVKQRFGVYTSLPLQHAPRTRRRARELYMWLVHTRVTTSNLFRTIAGEAALGFVDRPAQARPDPGGSRADPIAPTCSDVVAASPELEGQR